MQIVITLFIFGVIAIVLLGWGIWLTRGGIRGVADARASLNWPSTIGKIVSTTVVEERPVGTSTGSGTRRTDYRPVVQYSYSVNGQNYSAGHRRFNDDLIAYGSTEKAEAAIEKYRVGQTVQVYYDPANPRNAVLEPGKAGPAWRGLTGGILCLLLTLIPIWMGIAVVTNSSH